MAEMPDQFGNTPIPEERSHDHHREAKHRCQDRRAGDQAAAESRRARPQDVHRRHRRAGDLASAAWTARRSSPPRSPPTRPIPPPLRHATHAWFDFIKNDPPLLHGITHTPRLVVFGGGFPIHLEGEIVGAIGLSGGHYTQDMECARAALAAIGAEAK
jgi:hypothetical protein